MTNYDPNIIQKFADRLYKQAKYTIILYTIIGLLIGAIAGYFLMFLTFFLPGIIQIVITAILGALIGFFIGKEVAFILRFKAQTALCQMKIEQNTGIKSA